MEDKLYRKAIQKFGVIEQSMIAMEECAELAKEISKQVRGTGRHDSLVEEIADVLIVIEQVKLMWNVSEAELGNMIKGKRKRLERLIDNN